MAHRLLRALLLAVTLTAVVARPQHAAQAAGPAVVAVSPASTSTTVGDEIVIDITAANVPEQPGIGGYLIVLEWDAAVLTLTSISDAGWLTAKGGNILPYCDPPDIDNVAGTAAADCSPILAFGLGASPSGPLVHAVFRARAPGSTAISLEGSALKGTSESSTIDSSITGGTVTVAGSAAVAAVTDTPISQVTATAASITTSTPQPSSTAAAAATATASRPTPRPAAETPSTKPTQQTLSKVDVPRTGSGTPTGADNGGIAWWIPALTAVGAALLGLGGFTAFRWAHRRTDKG